MIRDRNTPDDRPPSRSRILAARWGARIGGLIALAVFLTGLFGNGAWDVPKIGPFTPAQYATLILALAGFILAWKWEGVGGAMSLLGICGFYAAAFRAVGHVPTGSVFPFLPVPGMLFLMSWREGSLAKHKEERNVHTR